MVRGKEVIVKVESKGLGKNVRRMCFYKIVHGEGKHYLKRDR